MDGEINLDVTDIACGCGPLLADPLSLQKPLRQRIFEHVRANGNAARADISRALGVSPGSATTLTADLIRAGLLREVAQPAREQGRGRPPVALEIVPEAGYVIGIKLGDEQHSAALADFAGNMIACETRAVSLSSRPLTRVLDEVEELTTRLLDGVGMALTDVQGIGIGMAGIIDHTGGRVHWSPLLDARDQEFGAAFAARFGLPVYLENDANMLTLAELWFGSGRDLTDFAVVTIENGVGMGLVLNNQLYRGSFGMGLELGHTKVQLDGALCRCGQRGCLEAYLADYALVREAATALNLPGEDSRSVRSMSQALYDAAETGDEAARRIFQRAGRYLSVGLSNVVHLFDPALIILSGERSKYDFMYAEDVVADVQALTLSRGQMPCEVKIHSWGDLAWARGATARALSEVTDALFNADAAG